MANENAPAPNLARRSMSIFSRKGCETPLSTTSLAVASMALGTSVAPIAVPSHQSIAGKSRKWSIRRQSDPKSAGGTIIRLVPKEHTPKPLSALEIQMATAPNDEILRNIGISPEEQAPEPVSAIFFSPTPSASVSSRKMSRRNKQTSGEIVGTWKDGNMSWAPNKLQVLENESSERPRTSDGNEIGFMVKGKEAPKLQVVIPLSSQRMFTAMPYIARSSSDYNIKPFDDLYEVSPVEETSKALITSSRVSSVTVSPQPSIKTNLKRTSSIRYSKILEETSNIDQLLKVPSNNELGSSSGSSSGSISGDEESHSEVSSHRSSITSLDSVPNFEFDGQVHKVEDHTSRPQSPSQDPYADHDVTQYNDSTEDTPTLSSLVHLLRTPSTTNAHQRRHTRSLSSGHFSILRTLPEANEDQSGPSPTLSEAERELERTLSTSSHVPSLSEADAEILRQFSVMRKPLLPTKSERRLTLRKDVRNGTPTPASKPVESPVTPKSAILARSSSVRSTLSYIMEEEHRKISPTDAERVIFVILENSGDLDDLFSLALLNRGFYRVYKRNALKLMQGVLKNMSPAAWEFRMTSIPCEEWDDEDDSAAPVPEYNASTFYELYVRDAQVIARIKALILERCKSILRPETVKALKQQHELFKPSRIDNALYRIWTFCTLFGCQKAREDDVITQLDWLRGGAEAHQMQTQGTFSGTDSMFMNSILLITSEHFGKGNGNGLSAEELYDMTELWNCIRTISQSMIGRTEQARQFGVFDDTDIRGGDIDGEEMMLGKHKSSSLISKYHNLTPVLEEWHNYLLTLGLSVILEVSATSNSLLAFSVASRNRWTSWSPPIGGATRAHFLRDAVSRLYEERICEAFSPISSVSASLRNMRRQRGSLLAADLKKRKASLSPSTPSLFTEEVLLSRANTVIERLSAPSSVQQTPEPSSMFDSHPALRQSAPSPQPSPVIPQLLPSTVYTPPPRRPAPTRQLTQRQNAAQVHGLGLGLPPTTIPMPGSPSTGNESRSDSVSSSPPAYQPELQHPFQRVMQTSDASVNSAEKAIFRLVEMGFTSDEAKGALKITDMGDGLRIDRAIEYLIRQQEGEVGY